MLSVDAIHFEVGFCTSKKGEIGGDGQAYSMVGWLGWLQNEWPWLALTRPFLTLLAQMVIETTPLPL